MSKTFARIALAALPLLAGLGATSLVVGNDAASTDPVRCEIAASASGNMIEIEAMLHSAVALEGTYKIAIESASAGGNAHINQGGAFSIKAGQSIALSKATLGANSAYDVKLEINAPGANLDCEGRLNSPA